MLRVRLAGFCCEYAACSLLFLMLVAVAAGKERVIPEKSKGGTKHAEPWVDIPESFRASRPPEWPLPTDLKQWQSSGRDNVRKTLLECLGEMPARPDPAKVKVISSEDKGEYTLERFEFFNGVDMLEQKLAKVYALHGEPANFRSILYRNTGHEYLPEMRREMVAWFQKHLAAK